MKVRVAKWGRTFVVRLPAAAVRKAGFSEGDLLEVESHGDGQIELRRPDSGLTLQRLVAQITPKNRYKEVSTGPEVGTEGIE